MSITLIRQLADLDLCSQEGHSSEFCSLIGSSRAAGGGGGGGGGANMLFTALKSLPLAQNCELGFFTRPRSQFYHYTDIPAGKELVCNTCYKRASLSYGGKKLDRAKVNKYRHQSLVNLRWFKTVSST